MLHNCISLHETEKKKHNVCWAEQEGDRYPPQVKTLEWWLDSVSIGESPKNVERCKGPAVRSEKFCCPEKTHDYFYIYHIDFRLCDRSQD